jgi:hypothetical protein
MQPTAHHSILANGPDITGLVHKALSRPDLQDFLVGINLMQPLKPLTRNNKRVTDQQHIATLFIATYAYIQWFSG